MTDTDSLIEQLSRRAEPVRPLASPLRRTLAWLAIAVAVNALVVVSMGFELRWAEQFASMPQLVEWSASLLTGVLAAYAVFQISVPGRSPSWAWLPVLPLAVWLLGLGWGCVHELSHSGMAALSYQAHDDCARAIAAISVPLALAMFVMVRHAGVLRPAPTAMLAALSAAALSSAGVSLVHQGESSLMTLLWHFGAVALLSLVSLAAGRRLFAWLGPTRD